jgi:4-amino-4-deoxy-L-arabinose transferase-like glycosyltransferase
MPASTTPDTHLDVLRWRPSTVDTPEAAHHSTPSRSPWLEIGAWLAALALGALLLAWLHLATRDPDSRLHVGIAARLAEEPPSRWIAPEWWGLWRSQGLFREHPAGIFWLPALFARVGYPATEAAYLANALYQALTLIVLARLAALVASPLEARALTWLVQLIPIAFVYRVRANHEQAVLLCVLAALLATERSLVRARWAALTAVAFAALALVKGVFVILAPVVCGVWLLLRGGAAPRAARRGAWIGLGAATLSIAAVAAAYEWSYRAVTGQPFLAVYLGQQLGVAAAPHSEAWLLQKAENLIWYVGRVLFFPLPWSLAALVVAVKERAALARLARSAGRAAARPEIRALASVVAIALLYVAAFSLSDRKADRYIFPVYFLVAGAGGVAGLRAWPWLRRAAERLDRLGVWLAPAVWLATLLFHPVAGWLRIPTVKFWPSD